MEEELLLLDPGTFDLAPAAPDLLARLADPVRFRAELSPAQVEIVSPVCLRSADAVAALADGRRRVIGVTGGHVRLAGVGAHPFSEAWSAISPGPRYERIRRRFRWAARQGGLAAGVHVHLGIPGADRLLAVYNALRGYMPEVAALAAAAPFLAGRDTGLASIRPKLADALPYQGVAPACPSWGEYAELLAWGRSTGSFVDSSKLWWECRLHPRFGTIEVRVPDAQARLGDVEAVVTVVHGLGRWLASRHDAGDVLPAHPTLAIAENRWRAAADGVEGELIDLSRMRSVAAREHIARLLDDLEPFLGEDSEARSLDDARRLLERPHPGRYRAIAGELGLAGLTRWLAERTEDCDMTSRETG
ncbi:MAG: carboxylate-amine ligase [Gaiellales bacterium]